LVAFCLALILWFVFGSDTDALTLRAVASCSTAGAMLGLLSTRFFRGSSQKTAILSGVMGGLLIHPISWILFSAGSWIYVQWTSGNAAGTLLESAIAGLLFSLGSLSFGFLLTCPAFVGAAWFCHRHLKDATLPDPK